MAQIARADGGSLPSCGYKNSTSTTFGTATLVSATEASVVRVEGDHQVWQKVKFEAGQAATTQELARFDEQLPLQTIVTAAGGTSRIILSSPDVVGPVWDVVPGHVTRIDDAFTFARNAQLSLTKNGTGFALVCTERATAAQFSVYRSLATAQGAWTPVTSAEDIPGAHCAPTRVAALNDDDALILIGADLFHIVAGKLEKTLTWTSDAPSADALLSLVPGENDSPVIWRVTLEVEAQTVRVDRFEPSLVAGARLSSEPIHPATLNWPQIVGADAGTLLLSFQASNSEVTFVAVQTGVGALDVSATTPALQAGTPLAVVMEGKLTALSKGLEPQSSSQGEGTRTEYPLLVHQLDGSEWKTTSLGMLQSETHLLEKPELCQACGCTGSSSSSVALVLVGVWLVSHRRRSARRLA